jgi:DNA-binding NarL/FixJ family response regulator
VVGGARIRVALVEDNDVFREALELLLGLRPEIEIVAALSDGHDVVDVCRRLDPDVVVMDMAMPEINGLHASIEILRHQPARRILILSMYSDEQYVLNALEAGAVACLTKDEPLDEIVDAIHRAGGRLAPAE